MLIYVLVFSCHSTLWKCPQQTLKMRIFAYIRVSISYIFIAFITVHKNISKIVDYIRLCFPILFLYFILGRKTSSVQHFLSTIVCFLYLDKILLFCTFLYLIFLLCFNYPHCTIIKIDKRVIKSKFVCCRIARFFSKFDHSGYTKLQYYSNCIILNKRVY